MTLSGVGLQGVISPDIGNLSNLLALDLSFNPNLTGPLPNGLGKLSKLQTLNLQSCSFIGSIPAEIGSLKGLRSLTLNRNQLSGEIPPSLGKLTNVTLFDLSENKLSSIIPVSSGNNENVGLDNLTLATSLYLQNNSLSGALPLEICYLPNLVNLFLNGNNLSGSLPSDISQLQAIQILKLNENEFEGKIPVELNNLTTLYQLDLGGNRFNGTIPNLSNLQQLKLLRLSMNKFQPQLVPKWIGNLSMLQTLELNGDHFAGNVPFQLFNLPSLETLSLDGNRLNGTLTINSVANSLYYVSLQDNNIVNVTGLNLSNPISISLTGNPLCSNMSYDLVAKACSTMNIFSSWKATLTSCNISCGKDMALGLDCTCSFPLMFLVQFSAPSFSTINFSRINNLRVSLANHLMVSISGIWIGSANFTQDYQLVVDVHIFPYGSISFTQKKVADIMNQLSLQSFLLDEFGPYQIKSVILPPSTIYMAPTKKKSISTNGLIGVWVGVAAGLFILIGVSMYALWQKRRADKAEVTGKFFASWGPVPESGDTVQIKGARHFSILELKRATNNFSNSKEIGSGGYGKVYKGALPTGQVIAIKRAQAGSLQGTAEFKNEIELLSRVHHKNLVNLLGFCCDKGEQMLVYEYMPNGTLREHIFDHIEALTWQKRLEIALGSAKGLAYLHDLADPAIIHRDIKSANILLDEKFIAKVADFGLSKLAPVGERAHADGHISTQVKGTLGYLDPEYYMTQKLTEKSDVYSFGVVLLELITARPPIEKGAYIVRLMRDAWIEGDMVKVKSLLDPSLGSYSMRDMESLLNLSLCLVEESAVLRPSMSEVVRVLEKILSRISSSKTDDNHPAWAQNDGSRNHANDLYNDLGALSSSMEASFRFSRGFDMSAKDEPK
ncbi:hypothetical protein O6H91_11G034100 [Diphasiastrum complanatum]|uniref:Uncharacterized protein n=2 Tax=Diphasiastrum complanatum TaxID=34168 RepID=A0ACC2C832_DIPCM|nr:hypothetical protein O6H91_11G034100 [Diphasiastrum complanatum]KAJ7538103.1 hypothetical protein O6H91_11G034100 [Diphasiastrum complanatum]